MGDLYAFFGRQLVGVFHQTGERQATFEYADDPGQTPISLSLPMGGGHRDGAAFAYLDNLLPDRDEVRERWARDRGLSGSDPFTLLASYGEDVAGAVTLTSDPDLPDRDPEPLYEATDDDIAARIAALSRENTSWIDPRTKPRMSLAGAQGKFTLARIGDQWFWSTYEYPSTHILKPPARHHRGIDTFEHLGLELARRAGIEASRSERVEFLGVPTFIVERWDRTGGVRLHAEDLNQALGNRTKDKYDAAKVGAPLVARLLARYGMERRFVRQLAFNVAFGNSDAHAKNYSVLLAGGQVALAPLYDVVPVYLWPEYATHLAMPIGRAQHILLLDERNWRRFAGEAGLDADMVCEEAFAVMSVVADGYEDRFRDVGADAQQMRLISDHAEKLREVV